MTPFARVFHLVLRLVPERWRASVERDLLEEAARSRRTGWRQSAWLVRQGIGISFWIAGRSIGDRWRTRPGWRQAADSLVIDLRVAWRAILRQPWSTAAIVATLALGLSAATASFAVFHHVLLRPVPGVGDPDRLVTVYFQSADRQPTYRDAPREALAALRTAAAFEALGVSSEAALPVVPRSGTDAAFVRVEFVTDRYLDLLHVRARAGRMLSDEEIAAGRDVAVISERWWRHELNADPSAIGSTITVNRHAATIVGVVADYRGWGALRIGSVDIWMPMDTTVGAAAVSADRVFNLVGRLRPDATAAIAEQQLRAAFVPFASSTQMVMSMGALSTAPAVPVVYPGLHEAGGELTRAGVAGMYPFALGASALLLLLACANTANLLLARTLQRRRDWAVRAAIGAGRWRIARTLLVEAALITSMAVASAVLIARVLVALVQGERVFAVGPPLDLIAIDWRVLGVAATLGAITVLLFGLLPAFAASRAALPHVLSQSGRTTRQGNRLRATLVGVQLALAVTLLSGAGVLVRSLLNLRAIDLGMNPHGVVSFGLNPVRLGYRGDRVAALVRDTLTALQRLPGVEAAAFASPSPFWRGYSPVRLKVEPTPESPEHTISTTVVSADYFRTLEIPVRAGRVFAEAEFQRPRGRESDGILSESLARQLFGASSAVGRRVYVSQAARDWELNRTIAVVGVVGDTRSGVNLRAPGRAALYEPAAASIRASNTFFVRSRLAPSDTLTAVRMTMRTIDPNLPITDAGAVRDEIERLIPEERVLALLVGGVALIATLLGVAGVHAVVAHAVTERTREFGIRLALGASRQAVSYGVLRGVCVVAAFGLLGGLALFAGASRLLESRVYGVSPADPMTLVAVSAVLVLAALAGAWLPARRATRVDPAAALRAE